MINIKQTLNRVIASKFLKSILQLATGSFVAQIITILASPISTRLFTADQLGIYTMILTFSSIFGPVIAGRYDMAIVTAIDEEETFDLIIASLINILIFSVIITVVYHLYLTHNIEIYKEVGYFAYIIIFSLILQGIHNILINYNNRHKEYSLMSKVYVIRAFAQNITMVIFGVFNVGAIGLLLSQFVGLVSGLKKQSIILLKSGIIKNKVNSSRIKNTLWKYRNQFIYSMPAHFTNSASYSLLNFFISELFGFSVFGYYSLSYRILGLPLNLISDNVSKVFYQRATEEKNNSGNYRNSFRYMSFFLIPLSVLMTICFIFFGPYVFELVFGEGWYVSGRYVQILAPMFGFRFVVTALSPALLISQKQKLEFVLQNLFIMLSVGVFFISKVFTLNIEKFLACISISYSIVYLFFLIIIYQLSKKNEEVKK